VAVDLAMLTCLDLLGVRGLRLWGLLIDAEVRRLQAEVEQVFSTRQM
jgi:hypothetical protein